MLRRAAVYFEMGEYDKCAADCDTAVERGREARADYKIIARALTRKGNALMRQGRLEEAIQIYQKSLTEHRCAHKIGDPDFKSLSGPSDQFLLFAMPRPCFRLLCHRPSC